MEKIPAFGRIRPKFQFAVEGLDKNSNVYKKRPEFQRLEGYGKNSNVCKNRARSHQCLRGWDPNSNV